MYIFNIQEESLRRYMYRNHVVVEVPEEIVCSGGLGHYFVKTVEQMYPFV